jgi:hypothetical protein
MDIAATLCELSFRVPKIIMATGQKFMLTSLYYTINRYCCHFKLNFKIKKQIKICTPDRAALSKKECGFQSALYFFKYNVKLSVNQVSKAVVDRATHQLLGFLFA